MRLSIMPGRVDITQVLLLIVVDCRGLMAYLVFVFKTLCTQCNTQYLVTVKVSSLIPIKSTLTL